MPRTSRPARTKGAPRRSKQASIDPRTLAGKVFQTTYGTAELRPDEDGLNGVTLYVNAVPSSYIDFDDPSNVVFEYLEIMQLIIGALDPGPLAVTHLGAAGCTLARSIDYHRPGSTQIAVDLDPKLLELVRTWFDLPRSPALRLRPGDARQAVQAMRTDSADVVVRDAFDGAATPSHLTTAEFVTEVFRVLKPGGLYLANIADRPPLRTTRSEVATIQSVLGSGASISMITEPAIVRGRRFGNVVIAATTAPGDEAVIYRPALERQLRSLAVPMRTVRSTELEQFVAGSQPLHDLPGTPSVAAEQPSNDG